MWLHNLGLVLFFVELNVAWHTPGAPSPLLPRDHIVRRHTVHPDTDKGLAQRFVKRSPVSLETKDPRTGELKRVHAHHDIRPEHEHAAEGSHRVRGYDEARLADTPTRSHASPVQLTRWLPHTGRPEHEVVATGLRANRYAVVVNVGRRGAAVGNFGQQHAESFTRDTVRQVLDLALRHRGPHDRVEVHICQPRMARSHQAWTEEMVRGVVRTGYREKLGGMPGIHFHSFFRSAEESGCGTQENFHVKTEPKQRSLWDKLQGKPAHDARTSIAPANAYGYVTRHQGL